ncbi:MAG: hypothetical protein GY847_36240 [Proteobacteria bacterium]|nr:hypothetical protein [Pseudomonadota bacterium]
MMFSSVLQSQGCRAGALAGGLVLVLISCSKENGDSCLANVDCGAGSACVEGRCIDDAADCIAIGAFAEVAEVSPEHADQVHEIHVAVDSAGALRYCYYGQSVDRPVSYYGRQVSAEGFEEIAIMVDGNPASCGAITVDADGGAIVFSRDPSAILFEEEGTWTAVSLEGLQLSEAKAALVNDKTLISLTSDKKDGVYISLSLGFEIRNQPVYLAHATRDGIEILLNGWSDHGVYTATGHAPQIIDLDGTEDLEGPLVLLGELGGGFSVQLTTSSLSVAAEVEGGLPRAAIGPDGRGYALYIDRQYALRLDAISAKQGFANTFEELAVLGEIGFDESDGQLPWDMSVDQDGAAHVLYEDKTQGNGVVLYRRVNADGTMTEPLVVETELVTNLPGMQRYALSADICGRATVVTMEKDTSADAALVMKVIEGR